MDILKIYSESKIYFTTTNNNYTDNKNYTDNNNNKGNNNYKDNKNNKGNNNNKHNKFNNHAHGHDINQDQCFYRRIWVDNLSGVDSPTPMIPTINDGASKALLL